MWILGSNLEVVSFPDKQTWGAASYADKETLYQDVLNLHKEIGKGIYGIIWSICVGNVHTSNKTSTHDVLLQYCHWNEFISLFERQQELDVVYI